jgi:hypothetical protein
LTVSDLNRALVSIHKVLQESSVAAASFNFKKKTGHYRVWFNLFVARDTNIRIMQRLSEIPEITQLETGSNTREFPPDENRGSDDRSDHIA